MIGPAQQGGSSVPLFIICIVCIVYFLLIRGLKKKGINPFKISLGDKIHRLIFSSIEAFFLILNFISLTAEIFKWNFLDGMSAPFSYYNAPETLDYFGNCDEFQIFQIMAIVFLALALLFCILSAAAQYILKSSKVIFIIYYAKLILSILAFVFFIHSAIIVTESNYDLTGSFALPCVAQSLVIIMLIIEDFVAKKDSLPENKESNNIGNTSYVQNTNTEAAYQSAVNPTELPETSTSNILSINIQKLNEISFCDKCSDFPDQLYSVIILQGSKSKSFNLCKNCALVLKQQVDAQNIKINN